MNRFQPWVARAINVSCLVEPASSSHMLAHVDLLVVSVATSGGDNAGEDWTGGGCGGQAMNVGVCESAEGRAWTVHVRSGTVTAMRSGSYVEERCSDGLWGAGFDSDSLPDGASFNSIQPLTDPMSIHLIVSESEQLAIINSLAFFQCFFKYDGAQYRADQIKEWQVVADGSNLNQIDALASKIANSH